MTHQSSADGQDARHGLPRRRPRPGRSRRTWLPTASAAIQAQAVPRVRPRPPRNVFLPTCAPASLEEAHTSLQHPSTQCFLHSAYIQADVGMDSTHSQPLCWGGLSLTQSDTPANVARWNDGHCSYGEACKYAHGEGELRANIAAAAQYEGMGGAGAVRCDAFAGLTRDQGFVLRLLLHHLEIGCMICFNRDSRNFSFSVIDASQCGPSGAIAESRMLAAVPAQVSCHRARDRFSRRGCATSSSKAGDAARARSAATRMARRSCGRQACLGLVLHDDHVPHCCCMSQDSSMRLRICDRAAAASRLRGGASLKSVYSVCIATALEQQQQLVGGSQDTG